MLGLLLAAAVSTVHLKDGGTVRGEILSQTTGEVIVQTDSGARAIPAGQVARVETTPGYSEAGASEASIILGMGVPLSDVELGAGLGGGSAGNGSLGPLAGFEYLVPAGRRAMLGGSFEYFHRSRSGSTSGVPLAVTDVSGDSFMFMAMGKFILREGPTKPYLRLGLGAHNTSTDVEVTPLGGFVWGDTGTGETRRFADSDAWGLAMTARFGLEFAFGGPSFFSFETGWLGLHNAAYTPTLFGASSGFVGDEPFLHSLVFAGRWGWRF